MASRFHIIVLSLFLSLLTGKQLVANPYSFTQESDLANRYSTDIATTWQTGLFDTFTGKDNIEISYANFIKDKANQCIVLSPGRTEGYLKYQELTYDLLQNGYNIFIIDHRGQGISSRLLENPYKGYVKEFDDYADDLNTFINNIVSKSCNGVKPYLLAHSMGGAIAARYMQLYPDQVQAAVLSSPMIAVNGGGLPKWLAKGLVSTVTGINNIISDTPWYFFGQTDYQPYDFEDNGLTQSKLRYQNITDLYNNLEKIQLGGVTFHWLNEAIKAEENIFSQLDKLTVPTLLLQAGADTVVDNQAQTLFCRELNSIHSGSCPDGEASIIAGAKHELFFEQDKYRNPSLTQALDWFKQHPHSAK